MFTSLSPSFKWVQLALRVRRELICTSFPLESYWFSYSLRSHRTVDVGKESGQVGSGEFLPSSLGTAAEPIHCCFLGCCTCFCSWVGNESSLTPAGPFNRMFWLTRIHSRIGWCKKKGVRGRSGDRLSRFSFFFIEAWRWPFERKIEHWIKRVH